jgi:protein-S-isoprenylcysteine O-methyltransferase Ste14
VIALVLIVHALDFAVMWSLPVFFFEKRDGRLNLRWFATALPFAVAPTLLVLGLYGVVPVFDVARVPLQIVGMTLASASAVLVVVTWRTHDIRLSLWHMDNDAPQRLVTIGPYAWIRHPFYTSFLLGMFGALASAPQPGLVVTALYAAVILSWTAAREERRLSASAFGADYVAYIARTGRFLPRFDRNG